LFCNTPRFANAGGVSKFGRRGRRVFGSPPGPNEGAANGQQARTRRTPLAVIRPRSQRGSNRLTAQPTRGRRRFISRLAPPRRARTLRVRRRLERLVACSHPAAAIVEVNEVSQLSVPSIVHRLSSPGTGRTTALTLRNLRPCPFWPTCYAVDGGLGSPTGRAVSALRRSDRRPARNKRAM
jgi:hypothetical protein